MIQATRPARSTAVVRAVGWVTFSEILRDKILYNIVLCSFVLMAVAILASRLAVLTPERVILDFGMAALNLSCSAIAIITGAYLVNREFERRTALVALSRPISRLEFVCGKFAGLAAVIALNWFLLSVSFLAILGFVAGWGSAVFSGALFWAIFFLLLQGFLLAAIAILFSTFTTTSLAVILTIGAYLVGNNVSQVRYVATRIESGGLSKVLEAAAVLLPNLEHFNLGLNVTYGLPLTWDFALGSFAYGLLLTALCLGIAGYILRSKEN